jgi:hypothetical protein
MYNLLINLRSRQSMPHTLYNYMHVVSIYVYIMSFSRPSIVHVLTQVAALCLKGLEDKYAT